MAAGEWWLWSSVAAGERWLQLSVAAGERGCMGTGDCPCGDRSSESMSLVCEAGGACLSELRSICTCGPLMGNLPHDRKDQIERSDRKIVAVQGVAELWLHKREC